MTDLFFLLKVIFEGSVYPKSTQVPIIVNLLIELTFVTLCLMELSSFEEMLASSSRAKNCSLTSDAFKGISSCFSYITLDPIVNLAKLRILFQGLCQFFLPFNIFWLVTYMRGTDHLIKLSNMVLSYENNDDRCSVQFFHQLRCYF